MQKVALRRHKNSLSGTARTLLAAIVDASSTAGPVTLEAAIGRPATPRDWRSAEVLVHRGLIEASGGLVRARGGARRVLGR